MNSNEELISTAIQRLINVLRDNHYTYRTERSYVFWIKRFLRYNITHNSTDDLATLCNSFLSLIASERHLSTGSLNQARGALVFFFRHVCNQDLGELQTYERDKKRHHTLQVPSEDNISRLIAILDDRSRSMALLICGSGMRPSEVVRILIQDIDLSEGFIIVRDTLGIAQRVVPLTPAAITEIHKQISIALAAYESDTKSGHIIRKSHCRPIHHKLKDKTPSPQQYLYPSRTLATDARTGRVCRHHISDSMLIKALRLAANSVGSFKNNVADDLRNYFSTHVLACGADYRTLKVLLGDNNYSTASKYRFSSADESCMTGDNHTFPTLKALTRYAWLSRMLRTGLSLQDIRDKRWSIDSGDYSIYCLVEAGKHVRYIGITNQTPANRLRQHFADCGRGKNVYKENWLRSCRRRGVEVTIHILRSGLTAERAGMMEFELIRFFKKPLSLVNTHAGGSTGYAGLSEESKDKHRINTALALAKSLGVDQKANNIQENREPNKALHPYAPQAARG